MTNDGNDNGHDNTGVGHVRVARGGGTGLDDLRVGAVQDVHQPERMHTRRCNPALRAVRALARGRIRAVSAVCGLGRRRAAAHDREALAKRPFKRDARRQQRARRRAVLRGRERECARHPLPLDVENLRTKRALRLQRSERRARSGRSAAPGAVHHRGAAGRGGRGWGGRGQRAGRPGGSREAVARGRRLRRAARGVRARCPRRTPTPGSRRQASARPPALPRPKIRAAGQSGGAPGMPPTAPAAPCALRVSRARRAPFAGRVSHVRGCCAQRDAGGAGGEGAGRAWGCFVRPRCLTRRRVFQTWPRRPRWRGGGARRWEVGEGNGSQVNQSINQSINQSA